MPKLRGLGTRSTRFANLIDNHRAYKQAIKQIRDKYVDLGGNISTFNKRLKKLKKINRKRFNPNKIRTRRMWPATLYSKKASPKDILISKAANSQQYMDRLRAIKWEK